MSGGTRQRSPPTLPLLLVYRIADNEPYGQITLLHLFIYELERDFCGLAEEQCGKGYLKEKNLIGTSAQMCSMSAAPAAHFSCRTSGTTTRICSTM